MRLAELLSLFHTKFYNFNNTTAQMLDSIYHMKLKLFCNRGCGVKTSRFSYYIRGVVMDVIP